MGETAEERRVKERQRIERENQTTIISERRKENIMVVKHTIHQNSQLL